MTYICPSTHQRCCVTPVAASPLVLPVLVLLLASSLPLALPAATTSHACLGKQACQASEGAWVHVRSDGALDGHQEQTLKPVSSVQPYTSSPTNPAITNEPGARAKQLAQQQQQQQQQLVIQAAAPVAAATTDPLLSLVRLGYFGLWKAWLQRLHLIDGQLPDTFFVQPERPREAVEPGGIHQQCPARPSHQPVALHTHNASETICPAPWRQPDLAASLAGSRALERSRPQRPAPMCPAGGLGPFSPPPRAKSRPPSTTLALAIQVHVPSHRRQGVRYSGAGKGLRGFLRRWLLGIGNDGDSGGGSGDGSHGPRHVSVPSLRRWGLESPAAGLLVRVELLWLLDKAYVALTLLFLLPLLLGGALAGAAQLVDRLLLRSERCERRRLHARWQRQLVQQQGSEEAGRLQGYGEGEGQQGYGEGRVGVFQALLELEQEGQARVNSGSDSEGRDSLG